MNPDTYRWFMRITFVTQVVSYLVLIALLTVHFTAVFASREFLSQFENVPFIVMGIPVMLFPYSIILCAFSSLMQPEAKVVFFQKSPRWRSVMVYILIVVFFAYDATLMVLYLILKPAGTTDDPLENFILMSFHFSFGPILSICAHHFVRSVCRLYYPRMMAIQASIDEPQESAY